VTWGLSQSLPALLVELIGDLGKGNDGQPSDGKKGAQDKQQNDSPSHLAAQKSRLNFHGLGSWLIL